MYMLEPDDQFRDVAFADQGGGAGAENASADFDKPVRVFGRRELDQRLPAGSMGKTLLPSGWRGAEGIPSPDGRRVFVGTEEDLLSVVPELPDFVHLTAVQKAQRVDACDDGLGGSVDPIAGEDAVEVSFDAFPEGRGAGEVARYHETVMVLAGIETLPPVRERVDGWIPSLHPSPAGGFFWRGSCPAPELRDLDRTRPRSAQVEALLLLPVAGWWWRARRLSARPCHNVLGQIAAGALHEPPTNVSALLQRRQCF